MSNLKVQVFADGADIEEMKQAYQNNEVDGFTTNPSLMKKAGVTDYKTFAEEAVKAIPDASISGSAQDPFSIIAALRSTKIRVISFWDQLIQSCGIQ